MDIPAIRNDRQFSALRIHRFVSGFAPFLQYLASIKLRCNSSQSSLSSSLPQLRLPLSLVRPSLRRSVSNIPSHFPVRQNLLHPWLRTNPPLSSFLWFAGYAYGGCDYCSFSMNTVPDQGCQKCSTSVFFKLASSGGFLCVTYTHVHSFPSNQFAFRILKKVLMLQPSFFRFLIFCGCGCITSPLS
jgi:hypothetical protein